MVNMGNLLRNRTNGSMMIHGHAGPSAVCMVCVPQCQRLLHYPWLNQAQERKQSLSLAILMDGTMKLQSHLFVPIGAFFGGVFV